VGGQNAAVEELADRRSHPLYLLTHHDGVPYEQDGLRDGEHIREGMTDRFIVRLRQTGRTFHVMLGDRRQRLETAIRLIEASIEKAFRFDDPLGGAVNLALSSEQ
jgi:hypothetical protein